MFIQPAAWIGVPGLTLLTLLLAATPALGRRAMALGAVGLAAWAGFGLWRTAAPPPRPPGVVAVIAQGDIPETEKHDMRHAVANFDRYLALTREGLARAGIGFPHDKPVVVWPESSSPFALPNDVGARAAVAEAAGGVPVLAGTVRFDALEHPYNSLAAITGPQAPEWIYDKWHLVPFGEYSPAWVPLAVQLVPGGGFVPGPGPLTLHVPGLPPVGPLICYEAIFPGAGGGRGRPAGLAGERHQRRLVRQFRRARASTSRRRGCARWRRGCRWCAPPTPASPRCSTRTGGRWRDSAWTGPGRWWRRCPATCRRRRSRAWACGCRRCWGRRAWRRGWRLGGAGV